jgi:hypothetical protein
MLLQLLRRVRRFFASKLLQSLLARVPTFVVTATASNAAAVAAAVAAARRCLGSPTILRVGVVRWTHQLRSQRSGTRRRTVVVASTTNTITRRSKSTTTCSSSTSSTPTRGPRKPLGHLSDLLISTQLR